VHQVGDQTNVILLMLHKTKVPVCSEIHTHNTQKPCEHHAEFLNAKPDAKSNNRNALKPIRVIKKKSYT
jgi:hypothetical protein